MLFYYFTLFCSGFLLLYFIGHLILSLFSGELENNYSKTFFKLFTGLISSITLYSVVKTAGQTINTGMIVLAVIFIYSAKQKIIVKDYWQKIKPQKKELLSMVNILAFSSLIFFWKYYCLFNNGQDFPVVINADSIFHSNIAAFLNSSGTESLNTNYFYPPDGAHPYHYFESWTIAFFSFIFNSNHWIAEEGIVYPIYAGIIMTGTWALIEKFSPLTTLSKIIGLSTVFFGGFFFNFLSGISVFNLKETYTFNYNAIDEFWALKLAVAYIFTSAGILLFLDNKKTQGILVLLALPIATITLTPGIVGGVSLFIFCVYLFHKKLKITPSLSFFKLILPILVVITIVVFYIVFGASEPYITTPAKDELITEICSISSIKNKIILFIYRIIQLILLYSPVWLIVLISVYFSDKKDWKEHYLKLKPTLLITFCVTFASLSAWLLLLFGCGSKAYFFYATLPFLNILSVVLIAVSIATTRSKAIKWVIGIFMAGFMSIFLHRSYAIYQENKLKLWDQYSENFIKETYKLSKQIKNRIGGKIEGNTYFNNPIVIDNVDHISPYVSGFNTDQNSFVLTSLSAIDISKVQFENTLNKNYILTIPLYQFTQKLKQAKKYTSNENARIQFIKKMKIEYIVVNKDVELEESLKKIIKIQLKDPKSGTSFILLDRSKISGSN